MSVYGRAPPSSKPGSDTPHLEPRRQPALGEPTTLLAFSIDDATFREVVWRQFNPDFVTGDDTNEVLAHPSSHMRHDLTAGLQLDTESSIGQGLCNSAFHFESFFFFSQNLTFT